MKTTFKFIGAAVLGAAVLFGANSCKNTTEQAAEAAVAENATATPVSSIVYVDITTIMAEYQMAIDLRAEAEKKIAELEKPFLNKQAAAEKEIKRKQDNLQAKAKDFEDKYNKGHLTQSNAQIKMQEIQQLEQELNNYGIAKEQELAQEGAKVQSQINDELVVMNNLINDAISTYIQKYRVQNGYAMILIDQSDADKTDKTMVLNSLVLSADPALDVTAQVITGLNDEYNATK